MMILPSIEALPVVRPDQEGEPMMRIQHGESTKRPDCVVRRREQLFNAQNLKTDILTNGLLYQLATQIVREQLLGIF